MQFCSLSDHGAVFWYMKSSLHIVIVGSNASLKMGGEASKPYQFFIQYLKNEIDCTLITSIRCKDELLSLIEPRFYSRLVFVQDYLIFQYLNILKRKGVSTLVRKTASAVMNLIFQLKARKIIDSIACGHSVQIIIHQPTPISPLIPSLLHKRGLKLVLGPMSASPGYPNSSIPSWVSRSALKLFWFFNLIFPGKRRADLLLSSGPATTKVLNTVLSSKIRVFETLENAADDHWFETQNNPKNKTPMFLVASRLVSWKRVDLILEASALVAHDHRVLIAGSGPISDQLREKAKLLRCQNIFFLPWQSHIQIAKLMEDATAVMSASLQEAGGTNLQEAMAAGVPVIATAWGGHLTRVTHETGILVEPRSDEEIAQDFASAMSRLIEEPMLQRRLGKAGRERAEKDMRWRTKAILVLDLMRTL